MEDCVGQSEAGLLSRVSHPTPPHPIGIPLTRIDHARGGGWLHGAQANVRHAGAGIDMVVLLLKQGADTRRWNQLFTKPLQYACADLRRRMRQTNAEDAAVEVVKRNNRRKRRSNQRRPKPRRGGKLCARCAYFAVALAACTVTLWFACLCPCAWPSRRREGSGPSEPSAHDAWPSATRAWRSGWAVAWDGRPPEAQD